MPNKTASMEWVEDKEAWHEASQRLYWPKTLGKHQINRRRKVTVLIIKKII